MKYRDPETGEFKELYTKAADTLPVGTVVDYDGDEVPAGWEAAGSDDYSLEETFTGKYWIDGKKIYRKVVKYTASSTLGATGTTTNTNIPHGISNFDGIINCITRRANNLLPSIGGWSATDRVTFVPEVNSSNIVLRIVNDTWSAGSEFTFVLEYTKTKD